MNNAPTQILDVATAGATPIFQIGTSDAAPPAARVSRIRWTRACILSLFSGVLAGCAGFLPTSGPSAGSLRDTNKIVKASGIEVIDLNEPVDPRVFERSTSQSFSEGFHSQIYDSESEFRYGPKLRNTTGNEAGSVTKAAVGDSVEVSIIEAPPASLFGGGSISGGGSTTVPQATSASSSTTLKDQVIEGDGTINVPFAGRVQAAGRNLHEIEDDIVQRLKSKANQPQVLVQLSSNKTSYVSVFGPVTGMTRMPLTSRKERLLDALAGAGLPRAEVNKLTIRVTRGSKSLTMPMDKLVKDLRQNIVLQSGDVITVLNQPYSFVALGASGRSDEVLFEGQGINLTQALGRVGGLNDSRANAKGVFIFRFETDRALASFRKSGEKTTGGKGAPVVYRLDLSNPASFHIAKSFPIENRDLIYVANASGSQLQKFFTIIGSIVQPAAAASTTSAVSSAEFR